MAVSGIVPNNQTIIIPNQLVKLVNASTHAPRVLIV